MREAYIDTIMSQTKLQFMHMEIVNESDNDDEEEYEKEEQEEEEYAGVDVYNNSLTIDLASKKIALCY